MEYQIGCPLIQPKTSSSKWGSLRRKIRHMTWAYYVWSMTNLPWQWLSNGCQCCPLWKSQRGTSCWETDPKEMPCIFPSLFFTINFLHISPRGRIGKLFPIRIERSGKHVLAGSSRSLVFVVVNHWFVEMVWGKKDMEKGFKSLVKFVNWNRQYLFEKLKKILKISWRNRTQKG